MPPARISQFVGFRMAMAGLVLAFVVTGCGMATGSLAPSGGATVAASPSPAATINTLPPSLTLPPATATPLVTATPATSSASASPATAASPATSAAMPDLAADLIPAGRLVACIDFPTPVMSEHDEAGKPIGVNVEIAGEVAKRLGLEIDIRDTVFETLLDEVAGGRCDISISSQIITRTRLEQVAMVPYLQGIQHVVVREGNPTGITTLLDLCGQVLAVQSGTTHVDLVLGEGDQAGSGLNQQCAAAGRSDVDLRQFADAEQAVDALASGDADAYIGNDFVIIERPGLFELAADLPPIRLGIGIGLSKAALQAAVRGAVAGMIADGAYARILETYDVLHLALAEAPQAP